MDIRSFFSKETSKPKVATKRKAAVVIIDDEDEEENDFKPDVKKKKQKTTRPSRRILYDSDNEEKDTKESPKKKISKTTPSKAARKELSSAEEFFGMAPISHTKKIPKKAKKSSPLPVKDDTLSDDKPHSSTDDKETSPKVIDTVPETPPSDMPHPSKKPHPLRKEKSPQLVNTTIPETPPSNTPYPSKKPHPSINENPQELSIEEKPPLAKKLKQSLEATKGNTKRSTTPPPLPSVSPTVTSKPTTPLPEVPTRKMSYREYLNREGPKAPGSKAIPQGSDNCLFGLAFVFTGVGESLDRDQASELAKRYGGRVTTSISKKTDYVVIGEGAGESKLKKAQEFGTKQINEDEFLDLIRNRPAKSSTSTTVTPKQSRKRKSTTTSPRTPTTPSVTTPIATTPTSSKWVAPMETTPTSSKRVDPLSTTPTSSKDIIMATPIRKLSKGPSSVLWVDKYCPTSCKNIIGQQGKRSNVNKLIEWLKNWYQYHGPSSNKDPLPTTGDSSSGFKAALLSGPPGIGKTTSAILVCKELGYSYTELNASATRSKKSLQKLLNDSLSSHSLDSYLGGGASGSSHRHVFIMDEVDGMSGNEDRGGVQELIQLIKTSHVPVICICNDRHHQKIRSLVHYCYDLRFTKPKLEQIKGPMMSLAYKEGIKVNPQVLQDIIIASNYDIRQVIHNLSMLSAADSTSSDTCKQSINASAKTSVNMSPFDIVRKVFYPFEGGRQLSIKEKTDLFFTDYSFIPLFVQENYLNVKPSDNCSKVQLLHQVSTAADSIACGDIVSAIVRSDNAWHLLPTQAMFSSVLPGEAMRGSLGKPEFPQWLGNHSKYSKSDRILQQLQHHTRLSCSCNKLEFLLNYSPFLCSKLTHPLLSQGTEGVHEVIDTLTNYDLTRDDWENLVELNQYSGRPSLLSLIDTKVKTAFTKSYNKADIQLPYSVEKVVKKKTKISLEGEEGEDEGSSSEEEESLDLSKFSAAVKEIKREKAVTKKKTPAASNGNSKGKRQKNKK